MSWKLTWRYLFAAFLPCFFLSFWFCFLGRVVVCFQWTNNQTSIRFSTTWVPTDSISITKDYDDASRFTASAFKVRLRFWKSAMHIDGCVCLATIQTRLFPDRTKPHCTLVSSTVYVHSVLWHLLPADTWAVNNSFKWLWFEAGRRIWSGLGACLSRWR